MSRESSTVEESIVESVGDCVCDEREGVLSTSIHVERCLLSE